MMDDSMKEVLIDGNSPESFFRGLGAAVRSCEVSLLADYKIKFPETYREILLSLFGKNYGAGLTHIRTEAERNAEDFSFAFAADAKSINSDITSEIYFRKPLSTCENNEDFFEEEYVRCKKILDTVFEKYGLKADFISFDAAGYGNRAAGLLKFFSNRLQKEILCGYDMSKIKAAVYDTPDGHISGLMIHDEELRKAVCAVGYSSAESSENMAILNGRYGKEIWCCNETVTRNVSEFSVNADGTGLCGENSLTDTTDNMLFAVRSCASMYIYSPAVSAGFSKLGKFSGGLVTADTPWSGYYSFGSGLCGAAHFSHFVKPEWKYLHCNAETNEYAVFISDDGDYTAVFVNDSEEPKKYRFNICNMDKSDAVVYCVETKGPDSSDDYSLNWFRVADKIIPAENAAGYSYTLEVKPFSVMTCTTLSVEDVNGTETVKKCEYQNKPLALPFAGSFAISYEKGVKPLFSSEQFCAFELTECGGVKVLMQTLSEREHESDPVILFGDERWTNYSVKTEAKFEKNNEDNYVSAGVRFCGIGDEEHISDGGYQLKVYPDGKWQLCFMGEILEEDSAAEIIREDDWNQLRISAFGKRIRCYVNKNLVCEYTTSSPVLMSGRASLGSAYYKNIFRNFSVSPVMGYSYYGVCHDCLCGEFSYSEGWKKKSFAGTQFKNFTSVGNLNDNEYFEFDFTGNCVMLSGKSENLRLKIEIDGKIMAAGIFISRSEADQVFYVKEGLGDGTHHMKLIVLSGNLEFNYAETVLAPHIIDKEKISAVINDTIEKKPAKKLKKSTVLIGMGIAAMGAGAMLLQSRIRRKRKKKKL